ELVGRKSPLPAPVLLPRLGQDFLGDRRGDRLAHLALLDSNLAGLVRDRGSRQEGGSARGLDCLGLRTPSSSSEFDYWVWAGGRQERNGRRPNERISLQRG